MSAFETVPIPYNRGKGRGGLLDWAALAQALKELADGQAIQVDVGGRSKQVTGTVYQALRQHNVRIHIAVIKDRTVVIWENRNGK